MRAQALPPYAMSQFGFLNHLSSGHSITTTDALSKKLNEKTCSSSYMKAMILTHCPRGKPSASLDALWKSAKLISKAHSSFFSCGYRFC